jgi:hypothetical protein
MLGYLPPELRRAVELLTAYLDGMTVGRMVPPEEKVEPAGEGGEEGEGGEGVRAEVSEHAQRAAQLLRRVGGPPLNASACGPIYGETSPRPRSGATAREIVVVWGPGAGDTIRELFT